MVCLCTEQSINYFDQKLPFIFKFNKFSFQDYFLEILVYHPTWLKFRHVFQLRTKVQFYKTFSPYTEVIEPEQVIEMNKLNCGQIMLSKVPESHNIM